MNREESYSQILRSSSIIGGANALNYVFRLIRMKVVAVLLGPTGVGLIGLYQSVITLVGTASGLGIRSSGVREVARAASEDDRASMAQTVRVLRRACWITGLLGWALMAILAPHISLLVFGSQQHARPIAILGVALLFGAVSGGQLALLQGVRRIGDIARVNVVTMLLSTTATIAIYAWLGIAGIVPVLLVVAVVSLIVSWAYSRKVPLAFVQIDLQRALATSRRLVSLGSASMWSALLVAGVDLFTRSMVTRDLGVDAAGHYQAAWALSGMFAGFVLGAMGTDFYPRLTGAIHSREEATALVNEQIEVGVFLTLSGLLLTIALAPAVIRAVYSVEFVEAASLLPWFMLGVFGRVISWPIGHIQLAAGSARWFFATQTVFSATQLAFIVFLVPRYGLIGVAYAFAGLYLIYVPLIYMVGARLIGFRWSGGVVRLLLISATAIFIGMAVAVLLSGWLAAAIGVALAAILGVYSLRELVARLSSDHGLVRAIRRFSRLSSILISRKS